MDNTDKLFFSITYQFSLFFVFLEAVHDPGEYLLLFSLFLVVNVEFESVYKVDKNTYATSNIRLWGICQLLYLKLEHNHSSDT